jgi:hypothetical protein
VAVIPVVPHFDGKTRTGFILKQVLLDSVNNTHHMSSNIGMIINAESVSTQKKAGEENFKVVSH